MEDYTPEEFINLYYTITEPSTFIGGMKDREFIDWCKIGNVEELEVVRGILLEYEMYKKITLLDEIVEEKNIL